MGLDSVYIIQDNYLDRRQTSFAEKYIELGATRIGTSNGVGIVNLTEETTTSSGY